MIDKSVVDNSLRYNGVVIVGYESKYFYYLTCTKEVVEYANPSNVEELTSDDLKFKSFDVKYQKYRELDYEKVTDLILPCVPMFSFPRLGEIEQKAQSDVVDVSKVFVDKFKLLDKSLFTDEVDLEVASKVNAFVRANTKNENLFPSSIDEVDSQILIYDKGIASDIYNKNTEVVDFMSTGLGVMLEFYEPEVRQQLRDLFLTNKEHALDFAKNCWRTLLEVYRERSLEIYDNEIKKINENTTIEEFEKEYLLTTTQNEKERIKNLDHEPYLSLIDDPNTLIKYWPYNNINLESTDSIIINLGGTTVDEKFGGNKPTKSVYVSNDYFFRLINIIKKYIPEEQFALKDCRGLFTETTLKNDTFASEEQKRKVFTIKQALVNAKKAKLTSVKEKMLESLNKEYNEVAEEEVKSEIKEIITLIERTQEEIDRLSTDFSTVDILDFWPPALYPIPNELNPNK